MSYRPVCPLHHMPDCSPLLNGCSLPLRLMEAYERGKAEPQPTKQVETIMGFVHWVETNRAYNGSEHEPGQSLYNEGINPALFSWAVDYAREIFD